MSLRRTPIVAAAFVVAACGSLAAPFGGPIIEIAPGLSPPVPADVVEQRVLEMIQLNESMLGRPLAPARVLHMWYVAAGTKIPARHNDGTNPNANTVGPFDGPGWVVEAEGTFIRLGPSPAPGAPAHSVHAYIVFGDRGGGEFAMIPCWDPTLPAEILEQPPCP